MEAIKELVEWLVTYSVSGGFWHFVACFLIIAAIARIFRFVHVRVRINKKTKTKKKDKADEEVAEEKKS
jgi:large-conductance mechanosensitive channel